LNLLNRFLEHSQVSNFMKIRPSTGEPSRSARAAGQTDERT